MSTEKYVFKIRVANKVVLIKSIYDTSYQECRDYIVSSEKPDFIVNTTIEEIKRELKQTTSARLPKQGEFGNNVAVMFDNGFAEHLLICHKIANEIIKSKIVLIHGVAIAINGKCFIFSAPSGTGKTTHALNWIKMIPNTIIVNGDKPFVNVLSKLTYGSPWCGKEKLNTNISVPLSGLISLERGKENTIKPLKFNEMLPILLRHTYIPISEGGLLDTVQLLGKLQSVPCYKLTCNMDPYSAVVAFKELC